MKAFPLAGLFYRQAASPPTLNSRGRTQIIILQAVVSMLEIWTSDRAVHF